MGAIKKSMASAECLTGCYFSQHHDGSVLNK